LRIFGQRKEDSQKKKKQKNKMSLSEIIPGEQGLSPPTSSPRARKV
jgi:hypothetical protein